MFNFQHFCDAIPNTTECKFDISFNFRAKKQTLTELSVFICYLSWQTAEKVFGNCGIFRGFSVRKSLSFVKKKKYFFHLLFAFNLCMGMVCFCLVSYIVYTIYFVLVGFGLCLLCCCTHLYTIGDEKILAIFPWFLVVCLYKQWLCVSFTFYLFAMGSTFFCAFVWLFQLFELHAICNFFILQSRTHANT